MARPAGILPFGCAGGYGGLSTAHPCTDAKLTGIPAGHRCAAFPPPARRAIGAPVELRVPSAHFLEEPEQKQKSKPKPRSSRFSAFHRVRARMARGFTRGPCAAVRDGR